MAVRLNRFAPSGFWESPLIITHSQGATTSTWSVPKCHATSVFFTVSLGFFFSLFFFSSLNLIFSLSLTTAMLSGPGGSRLETLLNYACRTVLRKHRGFSTSAACRSFHPSFQEKNVTLLLPCSTVCPPSPLLIFLSFSLCFHPTTTPALLCLPSSTFHLINVHLAKRHSVSLAQHCGNPCHQTSGKPDTSVAFTHFASNILGLGVHDISLACSSLFFI